MNPGDGEADSERNRFLEEAVQYILDTVSREELQFLLTEPEAWERIMAAADLSKDESGALLECLKTKVDSEDPDRHQHELFRERFLKGFPQIKQELEERIKQLQALADGADKIHRGCTISNMVANSTSAAAGVLTILGLTLAPVTAGISLGLSATGLGLGAVAAVTMVSTSIVEHSSNVSVEAEADHLSSTDASLGQVISGVLCECTPKLVKVGTKLITAASEIGKNIRAIKLAKANPRLKAWAIRLMTTGRSSARSSRQMQKAFGGTTLAMTKGARILGAATAGIFVLMDVVRLVEEYKHLCEGAKPESAGKLRQQAQKLEKMLESLTKIHKDLQN